MTIYKIIQELQAQGKNVEYRKRADGGYLITRIGKRTFKDAKGNNYARKLTGHELSEKQRKQRTKAEFKRTGGKSELPPSVQKLLNKVQREWKKNNVKSGRITTKKVRWNLENLGLAETREKLRRAMNYAHRIAYVEQVDVLIQRLERIRDFAEQGQEYQIIEWLNKAIGSLRHNRLSMPQDAIQDIYAHYPSKELSDIATSEEKAKEFYEFVKDSIKKYK